jgi:uncharacterized protein
MTATQHVAPDDVGTGRPTGLLIYFLLGTFFGFVLVKTEVVSWFRIQEMFRFHSFHMYGVIGSALAVALPAVTLLKRRAARSLEGEPIVLPPKSFERGLRYPLGGSLFGVGWAFTGACPGPLFALLGAGVLPISVALASAVAGTWVYGWLRPRLPH